jgi:hypothetical protein
MSTSDDFRKLKPLQKIRTLALECLEEGIEETITEPIFGEDLMGVFGNMKDGAMGKIKEHFAHTTLQSQTYYAEGTTKGLIKLDQGSKALQDGQYAAILTNLRNIRTRSSLAESYAQISDLEATLIQAQLSLQAHYTQMRSSEILASPVTSLLELSQATRLQSQIHGKDTFTTTAEVTFKEGVVHPLPIQVSAELTYTELTNLWVETKSELGIGETTFEKNRYSTMTSREIHTLISGSKGLNLAIRVKLPGITEGITVQIDPKMTGFSADQSLDTLFRTALSQILAEEHSDLPLNVRNQLVADLDVQQGLKEKFQMGDGDQTFRTSHIGENGRINLGITTDLTGPYQAQAHLVTVVAEDLLNVLAHTHPEMTVEDALNNYEITHGMERGTLRDLFKLDANFGFAMEGITREGTIINWNQIRGMKLGDLLMKGWDFRLYDPRLSLAPSQRNGIKNLIQSHFNPLTKEYSGTERGQIPEDRYHDDALKYMIALDRNFKIRLNDGRIIKTVGQMDRKGDIYCRPSAFILDLFIQLQSRIDTDLRNRLESLIGETDLFNNFMVELEINNDPQAALNLIKGKGKFTEFFWVSLGYEFGEINSENKEIPLDFILSNEGSVIAETSGYRDPHNTLNDRHTIVILQKIKTKQNSWYLIMDPDFETNGVNSQGRFVLVQAQHLLPHISSYYFKS